MDGERDVFCYAANSPDDQPLIHYLAAGIQNTVCGVVPGQRLPYIGLPNHGQHYDKTGERGWRWCVTCAKMMGVALQSIEPVVPAEPKPRKKKSGIRH